MRKRFFRELSWAKTAHTTLKRLWIRGFLLFLIHTISSTLHAQEVDALKQLSLEELLNIEVISVSKRPEKITETASAIQVITGEDIITYGATNIAEALYLAGNLQVAQSASDTWRISARGFNTETANKLLVLMDGRIVYTPLYGGVFWDRQDYLLEDIKQIEVISGPGGTLWGVNAVNGVINITTKSAEETQGLYVEGAAGNELKAQGGARYGGKLSPNIHYRVYGRYSDRDNATLPNGTAPTDSWIMGQGGFRIDAKATPRTEITPQGDMYNTRSERVMGKIPEVLGGNMLGRLSHTFSRQPVEIERSVYGKLAFRL